MVRKNRSDNRTEQADANSAGNVAVLDRVTAPVRADAPFNVVDVPLELVRENPLNPRATMNVEKLARSIEQHGLLHAIVVGGPDEHGQHQLLAGRRRLEAFRTLGRTSIPAHVLDNGVERWASIMFVENHQREDVDPMMESDLVLALLERDGWTLQAVADTLGKSVAWVHRRANLHSLSEKARDARSPKEPLADWPTAWLEELALLPVDLQDRLVESQADRAMSNPVRSLATLRRVVRELLNTLAAATWKLDDPDVAEGRPACTACPKHSLAIPDLFGEDTTPGDLKKAHCLDGACFAAKLQTFAARAVALAKEKHGERVVMLRGPEIGARAMARAHQDYDYDAEEIVSDMHMTRDGADAAAKPDVLHLSQVREVKKGAKNAVPAVLVDGTGAGRETWIADPTKEKPLSANGPRGRGMEREKKKPKTLDAKRKLLTARRQRLFVETVAKHVDELKDSKLVRGDSHLLDLVATYGCDMVVGRHGGKKPKALAGVERRAHIFGGVQVCIGELLAIQSFERNRDEQTIFDHAMGVCTMLDIDSKPLLAAVEKENPEPKAWALEESTKKKPAAKANRTIAKLAKKIGAKSKAKARKA